MLLKQSNCNINDNDGLNKPLAQKPRATRSSYRAFGRDVTNARGKSNIDGTGKPTNGVPEDIKNVPSNRSLAKGVLVVQENQPGKNVNNSLVSANPLLPLTAKSTSREQHLSKKSGNDSNASSYQYTGKVDNIDERCKNDPLCVTDYVQQIYDFHRSKEDASNVLPVYMEDTQPHINENMRSILVDWLIEVHMKFKLVPETLFLTIKLIDRYLERAVIQRNRLQLLGVSSLLIASKYEEIYPPQVHELVYICDNAYSRTDIIDMETKILKTLEYKVTYPSAHTFLVRYLKAAHADKQMTHWACYLLDGTLQSYNLLDHKPSELAAASVFLARHLTGRNPWSPTLLKYTQYTEEKVAPIGRAILQEKSAASPDLRAVNKKYSSSKYGNVANKPLSCDF